MQEAQEISVLSAHVREEIDHWVAKFPAGRQRSAVIGALHAVQHENKGYLTPELMEAVARYLSLPPIQVFEVASFYSMFETRPVGRHSISVCTNICCMLRGGEQILAHVEKRAGYRDRREYAGWQGLPQAGRGVPGGLYGRPDDDGGSPVLREPDAGASRRNSGFAGMSEQYPHNLVCFATLGHERALEPRYLPQARRLRGLGEDARRQADARSGDRHRQGLGFAWAWRRRLSDRREVELHAEGQAHPEIRRLQLRRERARHLPRPRYPPLQPACGDRGHGYRRFRHGRYRRLQLYSRRVSRRADPALRGRLEGGLRRPACSATISGAPVSISICTLSLAPVPISAARRPVLLESLEGKQGRPRFKPPFPANKGLFGMPDDH